jgi:tetratricopeptide (TPR) repeat protein
MSEISPRFLRGLQANIAYWQQKTANLHDADIPTINPEFPNLLRAVEMGIVHPATRRETAVLITQAFFWVEQAAHWHAWLPLLSRLTAILQDDKLRIQLLKQQGQLYRSSTQFDAAIPPLQESAKLAQKLADQVALAEAYTHLCSIYRLKRAYQTAVDYGQKAYQLLENLEGVDTQVTAVLANLGHTALAQGKRDQAEIYLSKAAAIGRSTDQPTQIARILNGLAIAFHQQGKLEASQKAYEEALEMIQQTASRIDTVYVQLSLGSLLVDMTKLDEAEAQFLAAEKILQQMAGRLTLRAMTANNLGNVLLQKGEPAAAKQVLQRSVDLRQQLNLRLPLANAYMGLAQALHQLGQVDAALITLEKAEEILPEFPDDAWAQSLGSECQSIRNAFCQEI